MTRQSCKPESPPAPQSASQALESGLDPASHPLFACATAYLVNFEYGLASTVCDDVEAPAVVAVLMERSRGLYRHRFGEVGAYVNPKLLADRLMLFLAEADGYISSDYMTRLMQCACQAASKMAHATSSGPLYGFESPAEACLVCYLCLLSGARRSMRTVMDQATIDLAHCLRCCCQGTTDRQYVDISLAWALFEASACALENARQSTAEHLSCRAYQTLVAIDCAHLVPIIAASFVEARTYCEQAPLPPSYPCVVPATQQDAIVLAAAACYGASRAGSVCMLAHSLNQLETILGPYGRYIDNYMETCLYMAVANGRTDSILAIAGRSFRRFGIAMKRLESSQVEIEPSVFELLATHASAERFVARTIAEQEALHSDAAFDGSNNNNIDGWEGDALC